MALGKTSPSHLSPISDAIAKAQSETTGEIRVHLTQRWFERDSLKKAIQLFEYYGLNKSPNGNAVLLYVNLRKRKFAFVRGGRMDSKIESRYWDILAAELQVNLRSTQEEKAIALTVISIGNCLKTFFPLHE